MNHAHTTSNSPALSGVIYPTSLASQQQQFGHQDAFSRQEMVGAHQPVMYIPPNASIQYGAGVQGPYIQYGAMMQRPPNMMSAQLPQSLPQQQQPPPQQQPTHMPQFMPRPMLAGAPRFTNPMVHFQPQTSGYVQQEQQGYQTVVSPDMTGYPAFPPSVHPPPAQYFQPMQVPQRQDHAVQGVRPQMYPGGNQMQPSAQGWPMYQQTPVAQIYQPVVRAQRYTPQQQPQQQQAPPVMRHMIPQMQQPGPALQPAEIPNEPPAMLHMNMSDPSQRPSFPPRSGGTVYYDYTKVDGDEKGAASKAPAKRAIAIIDPNTGKNVLDTLESSQRQTSDEALQIQSEFSKKVTQRIALGDKAADLNEAAAVAPRNRHAARLKQPDEFTLEDSSGNVSPMQATTATAAAESAASAGEGVIAKVEAVQSLELLPQNEEHVENLVLPNHNSEAFAVLESERASDSGVDLPGEGLELYKETKDDNVVDAAEEKVSHVDDVDAAGESIVELPEEVVSSETVEEEVVEEDVGVAAAEEAAEEVSESHSEPDIQTKVSEIVEDVAANENISENDIDEPEVNKERAEIDSSSEVDDEESAKDETNSQTGSADQKLKYNYEPWQWSPFNQDGKKVYNRDFLLQLQFVPESTCTPPGLPNLPEIVRGSLPPRDSMREQVFTRVPAYTGYDFTPGYINERPSMGRGGAVKRGSAQKRIDMPVKVINIQRSEDVKLHKTKQAWKPAAISKEDASDPELVKTEELFKKMRGILNKITPSSFDRLLTQVSELPIDNEDRLSGCIKILFEKAISEPKFVKAYSDMAHRLIQLNVPSKDNPEKPVSFRKLLLNRCQEEFEKDKEDELDIERREKEIEDTTEEDKKKLLIEAKEEAITKSRRRSLGNTRFIGELFKLKMLTEAIMHGCIKKLLTADDEDSLELLCNLLTTIGKELETEKSKKTVDAYFSKLCGKKGLPPRIRFMIQDLCELRSNKWVPRRAENIPKTIDQIHKEAHEEKELAKQQLLNRPSLPQQKPRQDRRMPGATSSMEKTGEDGWSTAIGSSAKNRIDASKMMKIAKSMTMKDDGQLALAPQFAPSWQKAVCGMGSRGSSQEAEKPLMPSNRYSALENLGSSGSGSDDRSYHTASLGRPSGQMSFNRQRLAESSVDNQKASSLSHDRSRNASQERSHTLVKESLASAASQPSISAVAAREPSKERTPSKPSVELSRVEIDRKTTSILDELFGIEDMREAVTCVEELKSPNSLFMFVAYSINYVLEKKEAARDLTGALLHELLTKGMLSSEQFEKGLKEVLEEAENLAVDIPKFWEYLGGILAATVRDDHQLWHLVKAACQELVPSGKQEVLFRKTMEAISQKTDSEKTSAALRKSGLRWSDYVGKSLFGYSKQHNLEHLNPVREELVLLLKQHADNQPIFDWIQKNVSESEAETREFIRALVTAVFSCALTSSDNASSPNVSYTVVEEQILLRQTLLQRYLDHRQEREMQALYALQALVHSLEHPPNVLQAFFDIIYDKDIISEEAFWEWKNSQDPTEQIGKGVASQCVRAFFEWLKEASEEQPTGS